MLKKVLREMATSRPYSQAELARDLGVTESMLAYLIQDLVRRGYLKPLDDVLETGCHSGGCHACKASCRGCVQAWPNQDEVPKRWVLTAKGRDAVKVQQHETDR